MYCITNTQPLQQTSIWQTWQGSIRPKHQATGQRGAAGTVHRATSNSRAPETPFHPHAKSLKQAVPGLYICYSTEKRNIMPMFLRESGNICKRSLFNLQVPPFHASSNSHWLWQLRLKIFLHQSFLPYRTNCCWKTSALRYKTAISNGRPAHTGSGWGSEFLAIIVG